MGYVPGRRDNCDFGTWARMTQACHEQRKLPTFDAQMLAAENAHKARNAIVDQIRAPRPMSAGSVDAAGDQYMKVGRDHSTKEVPGFASVTRNIPGFTGYIPGKVAENLFGDGFSKTCESSLSSHFLARRARPHSAPTGPHSSSRPRTSQRPVSAPILTKDHTAVTTMESDFFQEIPLHNRNYQDVLRGWSRCEYTGCQIEPAGAVAPVGRQERFGRAKPPEVDGIPPGYTGYVPGKISENIFAERKLKERQISKLLTHKNKVRSKQR